MIDAWDISVITFTLFSGFLIVYQGRFFFRLVEKRSFSFLNEFPFEMTTHIPSRTYPLFLMVGGLFSLGFMSAGFLLFPFPDVAMNLMLLISWGLTGIFLFLLFIIDMKEVKIHLLLDTLLAAVSVLNFAFLGTLFLLTPYGNYHLAFVVISYLLGLFPLLLALNPKLKHWATMEEQIDANMTLIYVRPKYFVLAYSEWLLILSNIVFLLYAFLVQWIA